MNISYNFLIFILIFFLISHPAEIEFDNAKNYTIIDTIEYSNAESGGNLSFLKLGDKVIDTIYTDFGFHFLGKDSIIYQKVSCDFIKKDNTENISGFCVETKLMLFCDGKYRDISTELPDFNYYFSAPRFYDGFFYYWGIPYIIDYTIDVYATKFNLRTQKLDKVFLVRHSPAPGYTGYWGAEICGSYFEFKRDDPQVDSIYGYLVDFDNKVLVKTYSMKRKLNRK